MVRNSNKNGIQWTEKDVLAYHKQGLNNARIQKATGANPQAIRAALKRNGLTKNKPVRGLNDNIVTQRPAMLHITHNPLMLANNAGVVPAKTPVTNPVNLVKVKAADDEYYTDIGDVEMGVQRILLQDPFYFNNKIVYCNCDDYEVSKVYEYFHNHFDGLGLKQLICTGFKADGSLQPAMKCVYDGKGEPTVTKLSGNGSYYSEECMDIARKSNVIFTNPPFSIWEEFLSTMRGLKCGYNVDFMIAGDARSRQHKEILTLVQWGVLSFTDEFHNFTGPDGKPKKGKKGNKASAQACWFTTIKIKALPLKMEYQDTSTFEVYKEENAIVIPDKSHIAVNHDGLMLAPVSCLPYILSDNYFEIIRIARFSVLNKKKDKYTKQPKILFRRRKLLDEVIETILPYAA